MLYNFHDSPRDLFERMRLNVGLNEELGIRIWSFPMRYQPTNLPDRSHIGEKWCRYQLRSLQLILQATHGVVSGNPTFFKRAFGDSIEEFEGILLRPHHFIFNREWYERLDGRAEFEEYTREFAKMSAVQKTELLMMLSSRDPRYFPRLLNEAPDSQIRKVLHHYVPISKDAEEGIWHKQSSVMHSAASDVPDDERVEDAGLGEDTPFRSNSSRSRKKQQEMVFA